jgi:hypothetical protein
MLLLRVTTKPYPEGTEEISGHDNEKIDVPDAEAEQKKKGTA